MPLAGGRNLTLGGNRHVSEGCDRLVCEAAALLLRLFTVRGFRRGEFKIVLGHMKYFLFLLSASCSSVLLVPPPCHRLSECSYNNSIKLMMLPNRA